MDVIWMFNGDFQGGRQKLWDRHGTGQGASNAIDIAIASSMMLSWNSAAVEQFAKPLLGLEAENQLVLTARPECLQRVDPDPPSMWIVSTSTTIMAACADKTTRSAKRQRNSCKVHVNLCAVHHSDFGKNSTTIRKVQ